MCVILDTGQDAERNGDSFVHRLVILTLRSPERQLGFCRGVTHIKTGVSRPRMRVKDPATGEDNPRIKLLAIRLHRPLVFTLVWSYTASMSATAPVRGPESCREKQALIDQIRSIVSLIATIHNEELKAVLGGDC